MHFSNILPLALFTPAILSSAIPSHSTTTTTSIQTRDTNTDLIPFPFDEAHASYIEDAFDTIAAIPDSVFDQGDDAVKQWVLTHASPSVTPRSAAPPNENLNALEPRQSWLAVAKCAIAIGTAIIENGLPIAKLRRIKEVIELLGGAKKVAKLLLKAKSIRELIIIGGPELMELAEILLGVTDIVKNCFHF